MRLLVALALGSRWARSRWLAEAALVVGRRRLPGLALGSLALGPPPAQGGAEWIVGALQDKSWSVSKRQESSVRIRPETMLVATTDKSDRELKVVKVPLGRSAAPSFDPDDQYDLARFFASRGDAEKLGAARIQGIMAKSLERQAKNPASPLQAVAMDPAFGAAAVATRGGRRYVSYAYETDGCRRLDEDGGCLRRSKRAVAAAVTVSLESQARTLEEQRRMDRGELEDRKIDTLWIVTCSAPAAGIDDATRGQLRGAVDSFEVLVQDAVPAPS